MRVIIILLLTTLSLRSAGQAVWEDYTRKKEKIAPLPVDEPQLIDMDDCVSNCIGVHVFIARKFRNPFHYTFLREDIAGLPTNDFRDWASNLPGVYQSRRGDDLHIYGARANGTLYIVDGIQLQRK